MIYIARFKGLINHYFNTKLFLFNIVVLKLKCLILDFYSGVLIKKKLYKIIKLIFLKSS